MTIHKDLICILCYENFLNTLKNRSIYDFKDDEKDLFKKAKNNIDKFKNINEPTKFIIECGLDDTRLNMSQELYKCMSELGYDVSLKISAGNHNWEYWNKCIQNTINTILADF